MEARAWFLAENVFNSASSILSCLELLYSLTIAHFIDVYFQKNVSDAGNFSLFHFTLSCFIFNHFSLILRHYRMLLSFGSHTPHYITHCEIFHHYLMMPENDESLELKYITEDQGRNWINIQLFRERLSNKMTATMPKAIMSNGVHEPWLRL